MANVRIDVQVIDKGQPVAGLTKDDFIVLDEGAPQPLVYFGRDSDKLSLLLLLDISGSTRQYIEQISGVARDSLRHLQPGDRVAVMVFARRSRVRLEWTDDHAGVAREIRSAIGDQSLGAATNINESLLDAAKYVAETAGDTGRRAVLIVTDNEGLNYRSPDEPVLQAMFGSDTVVNAIVVGKGRKPEKVDPGRYQNPDFTPPDVFRISGETGGEAVRADKAGAAFAGMIERIRTRYGLHYNKPAGAEPGFRKVEVTLSPSARRNYPGATLRFRKGYQVR